MKIEQTVHAQNSAPMKLFSSKFCPFCNILARFDQFFNFLGLHFYCRVPIWPPFHSNLGPSAHTLIFLICCFGSLFWLGRVPIGSQFHKNLGPYLYTFVNLGPYLSFWVPIFCCKGSLFPLQTVPWSQVHKKLGPYFNAQVPKSF